MKYFSTGICKAVSCEDEYKLDDDIVVASNQHRFCKGKFYMSGLKTKTLLQSGFLVSAHVKEQEDNSFAISW